ncbi:MAG: polymer-forming cytoskeletal protein [Treponemataceae bacterium]|nr:polymer-forming cytoskeletal protein [Treponemataceae bacterium]
MAKNERYVPGNLTVLGEETEFDGVLEYSDNLVVTGKFSGTIKSNGYLEISQSADCKVDSITASTVIISGNVSGNINARETLEMNSGSHVTGDISTKKLCIADDVEFHGAVSMLEDVPEIDIFSMEPAEYKQQMKNAGKADNDSELL